MKQGYLEKESARINEATKKTLIMTIIGIVIALLVIFILGKDSIDFSDITYDSVSFYLIIAVTLILVSSVIRFISIGRVAKNGSNLFLPFNENTQEAVGNIIDTEARDRKIQVEEYICEPKNPDKAYEEKVVLLPSYLLLCQVKLGPKGKSKVTAIPRDKIYWICAQAGYKGGPYIVKLLIFTESKIFSLTGVDIKYVQDIADKLYQYIPNVFSDYDPFELSYKLEKIFAKNPEEFINIYEVEKKKKIIENS